jgi:hypothetical protein
MLRLLLAAAIGMLGLVGFTGAASAQTCNNGPGANTQEDTCVNSGDADAEAEQSGSASSGDGVAGQVAGVVSAGDASVDATNRSDDVSVTTGDASATNNADVFADTGVFETATGVAACNNVPGANTQEDTCVNSGDADAAADQSADSASGDGVGGQVIGVVTSAGGSADLVLDNESTDSSVDSGTSDFTNTSVVDSEALAFDVF